MRLLCASLLAGFALCGALQGLCWGRTQLNAGAALCADTLRLHIRAASDAVADQSAKLRVRDAVLAVMQQCPAQSAPEARAWAAGRLLQFPAGGAAGTDRTGHSCPGAGVSCEYVLPRPALSHRSAARRAVRCRAHRHRQRRRAQLVVCAVPGAVQLCAGRLRPAYRKRPCLRAVHPAVPAGGLGTPADCPAADGAAGGVTPHPPEHSMEGKEGSLYGDPCLLFSAPARLLRAGRGSCADMAQRCARCVHMVRCAEGGRKIRRKPPRTP